MKLKLDPNKLKDVDIIERNIAIPLNISYNFSQSHILSGSTTTEIKENIERIGGFDPEVIDKDRLEMIKKF